MTSTGIALAMQTASRAPRHASDIPLPSTGRGPLAAPVAGRGTAENMVSTVPRSKPAPSPLQAHPRPAARPGSGERRHRAVVVAVGAVGVVEVPVHEVVDVIAVRHGDVAAPLAVPVSGLVAAAAVVRGALRRVPRRDGERVLLDRAGAVLMVQVAVVEVVDVAVVLERGVAAAAAVRVGMSAVGVHGAWSSTLRMSVVTWTSVRA